MKVGYFEESEGNKSITRLMFAVLILMAVYVVIYQVMTTGTFEVIQFTTVITTACGLKLWQKSMEVKDKPNG